MRTRECAAFDEAVLWRVRLYHYLRDMPFCVREWVSRYFFLVSTRLNNNPNWELHRVTAFHELELTIKVQENLGRLLDNTDINGFVLSKKTKQ